MDEAIRNLCLALKGEADTVIGCTDKLASLPDGSNKARWSCTYSESDSCYYGTYVR